MAGFQFTDTCVTLDIAGHKFEAQATAKLMKKVSECGETLMRFAQTAKDEKQEIDIEAAEWMLREQIDALLGGGACDQIFEGREADYFDTLEVWGYIVDVLRGVEAKRPALAALKKSAK